MCSNELSAQLGCRQFHLNKMVKVAGVVTRRTGVFPQLQMVKYDCQKCGHLLGPYYQNTETEIKVNSCPQCQGKNCFVVRPLPLPLPLHALHAQRQLLLLPVQPHRRCCHGASDHLAWQLWPAGGRATVTLASTPKWSGARAESA